jgi:hypothetical protein
MSCAAVWTNARVLGETDAPSVNARDTADGDTPARRATSFMVTFMGDAYFRLTAESIQKIWVLGTGGMIRDCECKGQELELGPRSSAIGA